MSKKKEVLHRFTRQELMDILVGHSYKIDKNFPTRKKQLVDVVGLYLSNKQLASCTRLEHLSKDDLLLIAKEYNLEHEASWPETNLTELITTSLTEKNLSEAIERLLGLGWVDSLCRKAVRSSITILKSTKKGLIRLKVPGKRMPSRFQSS